jgi:hypothetical protein
MATKPRLSFRRLAKDGAERVLVNIVGRSKKLSIDVLEKALDEELKKAEATFLRVLELEIEFWNMNHGGDLNELVSLKT